MGLECELWALTTKEFQTVHDVDDKAFGDFLFKKHPADITLGPLWDVLHFVLCGTSRKTTPFPAGFLKKGGTANGYFAGIVDDRDEGFRFFTPEQVKKIADHLEALDHDVLRERYDPKKLEDAKVYPMRWKDTIKKMGFDGFLRQLVLPLTEFFRKAADVGHYVGIMYH